MWNILCILILFIELALLGIYICGLIKKRRPNETVIFAGAVFVLCFILHAIPVLYMGFVVKTGDNILLGLLDCVGSTIKLFVGEVRVDDANVFVRDVPLFVSAYLFGAALALLVSIGTAVEAFKNALRNSSRLSKAMKRDCCDIVIGGGAKARQYAGTCNAVLLVGDSVSRDAVDQLREEGYTVWRRNFTVELLKNRYFNAGTRYNIVCPDEENILDHIDTFIAYKRQPEALDNRFLYVEIEGDMAETIRREIIEKSGFEAWITTFCTNELLARTFIEANPITRYLPGDFIWEAAIRPDVELCVFILGFGKGNRELYRQSLLNNQLVSFVDGDYRVCPLRYTICDTAVDTDEWNIDGLRQALEELDPAEHFPLPELPYHTEVITRSPSSREVLRMIRDQVRRPDSYSLVVVDAGDDCRNIEIGAKLKFLLTGLDRFHVFVHSEASYIEDDATVSYFGRLESVFNHDVIVGDGLSVMARKLNEVYTAQYAEEEKDRPDFAEYVQKKAAESWNALDYFSLYSNIYSAMNLRVKLHLLGLDYIKDGKGENISWITERHQHRGDYTYQDYFQPSVRNALIAQEHARWNAYHLLGEYLPMEKAGIAVKESSGGYPRFQVKNVATKRHACLTTYGGLDTLSAYLAQLAGRRTEDYDYYIYDEMLITAAGELLTGLGYSVVEK